MENSSCQKCKDILECFSKYHRSILETSSLQTQNPIRVTELESILREKAKSIRYYIDSGSHSLIQDAEFKMFLECLGDPKEWEPHCRTCAEYWTSLMFDNAFLAYDPEHIKRLYNSQHLQ